MLLRSGRVATAVTSCSGLCSLACIIVFFFLLDYCFLHIIILATYLEGVEVFDRGTLSAIIPVMFYSLQKCFCHHHHHHVALKEWATC
jgi:hypothetical protein